MCIEKNGRKGVSIALRRRAKPTEKERQGRKTYIASTLLNLPLKSCFNFSLNNSIKFQNGAQYTKTCNIAFAKHKFPLLINPRGIRPGEEGAVKFVEACERRIGRDVDEVGKEEGGAEVGARGRGEEGVEEGVEGERRRSAQDFLGGAG